MNTLVQTYNSKKIMKNGKVKELNEYGSLYDGDKLKLFHNKNGEIEYKVLSRNEIEDMLFHNKTNLQSSGDLLSNLHKLREKQTKQSKSKSKSTTRKSKSKNNQTKSKKQMKQTKSKHKKTLKKPKKEIERTIY